jgi:hypothetical protein
MSYGGTIITEKMNKRGRGARKRGKTKDKGN